MSQLQEMARRQVTPSFIIRHDAGVPWNQTFQDHNLNPSLPQEVNRLQVGSAWVKNCSVYLLGTEYLGVTQFTLEEVTGVTQNHRVSVFETHLFHGAG